MLHANMAEGGGEENTNNPFSFKTYVKKKARHNGEQAIDANDIFATPGATGSSRKKEKQGLVVADDDDDVDQSKKSKKKGNKENPFSFKKFLGQSGQKEGQSTQRQPPADFIRNEPTVGGSSSPSFRQPVNQPSANTGLSLGPQAGVPPDFASDLPDFIQNHYDEPSRQELERRQLPDFTLQSRFPPKDFDDNPGSLFGADKDSTGDSIFSDEEDNGVQRSRQFSLPDFLVDSAIPGAQGGVEVDSKDSKNARIQGQQSRSRLPELPSLGDPVTSGSGRIGNGRDASFDDHMKTQLREENRQLKATIAQMQQRARDEETRVAGFEKEIARLRKKEAEETAVMERAVQQVEENLVSTTTRAVQAETLVTKLKQDIKNLQAQNRALTSENTALKSGDKGLADIRERTKYASEQLASAAVTAETNLRELLGGVEKLKLLGQVLSSLEKVADADTSPTHDSSPKASSV